MSHNQKRQSWQKEAVLSLLTGFLYGGTNTLVGHPFDTIKTKMQAQSNVISQKKSLIQITQDIIKQEGVLVLYKGCIPPFLGSILYRSLQFSVFEMFYTKWQNSETLTKKIRFTGGLELRVILAGVLASITRAIVECPFEYAKVRRQTQQKWKIGEIYTGFNTVLIRTIGMMTTYFTIVDTLRRHTDLMSSPSGQFLISGGASVISWGLIWPFELIKSQLQAGTQSVGSTYQQKLSYIYSVHGYSGFFRGFSAGAQSIFYRNGVAMIVMQKAQQKLSEKGYRD